MKKTASTLRRNIFTQRRAYHSYPDPNEKPVITTTRASGIRQSEKSASDFSLDEKFKMNKPFIKVQSASDSNHTAEAPCLCTTLPNGLRVASEDRYSLMTSVAFVIKAGSSYENTDTMGATQMMEINAFKSTSRRTHAQLSSDIEKLGGMVQAVTTRENIFFCLDIIRENLEPGLDILAETVLDASYPEEEMEETKHIIQVVSDTMQGHILSRDAVQMAAFQKYPLGNPHFYPLDALDKITNKKIHQFKAEQLYGSNCIMSACGVEHDKLVQLIEKKFHTLPSSPTIINPRPPSIYTGGEYSNERHLNGPFTRVCIGYECGGWSNDDLVPLCVLQTLLGGGSSFSAGGPGKGMYTRLYRDVLNKQYWVESCEAYMTIHEEKGVFGIDASCQLEHVTYLVPILIREMVGLSLKLVNDEELKRAKNMLKSMMMSQLESRAVVCEDIARQYLTYNFRYSASELCHKIEAVSAQDLLQLSKKLVASKPSIGYVGSDLKKTIAYDDVLAFTEKCKKATIFSKFIG